MKTNRRPRPVRPRLEELEPRLVPSTLEPFDTTPTGTLPADWSQWSSNGSVAFAVESSRSLSTPNSLAVNSPTSSNLTARSWVNAAQPANVQVDAAVYVNSLIPVQVLARGTGLDTTTPTYYAVSVTRGLTLKLLRVQNGAATTLGTVTSAGWFADRWATVTLFANGNNLRAQARRADTGHYLNALGQWQPGQTWALNLTDAAITGGGRVGLARPSSFAGKVHFDDFAYDTLDLDGQAPAVTITAPAAGATVSGVTTVQASATDNVGVTRAEFYVDGVLRAVDARAPFAWSFDTTSVENGSHTLLVRVYDPAQNFGQASRTFNTQNDFSALPRPVIPRHDSHIRLANLAYNGGSSTLHPSIAPLLQNSVDLVIEDTPVYLGQIENASPDTPQLLYSNVSNIYKRLLTDWLNYADANGHAREAAFYHVTQATPFSGAGGSTQPVTWFWGVYRGGATLADFTSQAHGSSGVAFAGVGQSLHVGYTDRFREINVNLTSGASAGWSAVLEYATTVDSAGNPTAWSPLTTIGDTTAGLTRSGRVTFDPPADWKAASLNGTAPLYYVRFRTLTGGTAPVARTLLGRDYVGANGTATYTIPAFDPAADANHDGYLNDAEYALRAAARDARFLYESRLFTYGQMRFVTNPGDAGFRSWAIDFQGRFLNDNPLADGLFIDNSPGAAPSLAASLAEPSGSFSTDYATLLYQVGKAVAPKWILANTGGGDDANPTIQRIQGYFDEFSIRPLAHTYRQFETLAGQVATRSALASPAPYAVLDSHPQGGSLTDPRTQLSTLAYYYLLADPDTTFLDYGGGHDTTGPWSRHWFPAMGNDIGQPAGGWSQLATGADPANPALTYRLYQRSYGDALVLYKPLSFGNGVTGTLADATATTHELGGTYYPLRVDGTLGAPITSITLRNGEGAILVKATSVATSLVVTASPSSTTAGATFQVTVSARDFSGQVVPGYAGTVHFTSTDGAAVLPADYTFTAADNGVHIFNVILKTAGIQSLTITDTMTGITGTREGIVVNPAAASRFQLTAPATVPALTPFRATVTALDPYGNRATDYAGTVHFTSSDSLAWLPEDYFFTAADGGQHTFDRGLILWQTGTQTLGVADIEASITGGTSILVNRR